MFSDVSRLSFQYVPKIGLKPSEMKALAELPKKDLKLILPIIPLRGWGVSKDLEKSTNRIQSVLGAGKWIACIDKDFLNENKTYQITGKYPRDVYYQLEKLLNPSNGYKNWFDFISMSDHAIPSLLLDDINQVDAQIKNLYALNRGLAVIITAADISASRHIYVAESLKNNEIENYILILDLGPIDSRIIEYRSIISKIITLFTKETSKVLSSITATSFPSSFSGRHHGEDPIYERLLFNQIKREMHDYFFVYSDYGSARAEKQAGGGGVPSPRIDYPLKNDWRFIRKEFDVWNEPQKGERERLYTEIANEIIEQDYWDKNLNIWGKQMIELTAMGDPFGITNPQKATAVRINIHLYKQLHYYTPIDQLDSDEDWED